MTTHILFISVKIETILKIALLLVLLFIFLLVLFFFFYVNYKYTHTCYQLSQVNIIRL